MTEELRNAVQTMIRQNWPTIQQAIQAELDNAVYKAIMDAMKSLDYDSYRRSNIASAAVSETLDAEIRRQTETVYKPALERIAKAEAEKQFRKRLKARGLSTDILDEWTDSHD